MPRIEHCRDKCIGCAVCAELSPDFEMVDDGKAKLIGAEKKNGLFVLEVHKDSLEKNRQAEESCPRGCIKVVDD